MNALIVPCTQEKIWDTNPTAGHVAAKDAYTKPVFLVWRRYAEKSGEQWFILSTKYGLIQPDQPIHGYNVPVSRAIADHAFLGLLKKQGEELPLKQFGQVVLLDWERFEPLVRAALSDQRQYEFRRL